jgi:ABC-type dipeptide/oligopeptide/nickel transport system ATPase component
MADPVLQLEDLTVRFHLKRGQLTAVDGVTFTVNRSETFGLVGESGSGKTVTARSVMRLVPIPPGDVVRGRIVFEGENILEKSPQAMRELRGKKIAMVFQEPMSALNPVFTVGSQISDALRTNLGLSKKAAKERVLELMQLVGIPSPASRYNNYVHEFSGGMRQRVMLAMALSCNPTFLIADEPTTALDVTIQATILELIRRMIERFHMSLIFITHNLGVVAHTCDTIGVMYASHLVELGKKDEIFSHPLHPYVAASFIPVASRPWTSVVRKSRRSRKLHRGILWRVICIPDARRARWMYERVSSRGEEPDQAFPPEQ